LSPKAGVESIHPGIYGRRYWNVPVRPSECGEWVLTAQFKAS
jgi:hypothetical protein